MLKYKYFGQKSAYELEQLKTKIAISLGKASHLEVTGNQRMDVALSYKDEVLEVKYIMKKKSDYQVKKSEKGLILIHYKYILSEIGHMKEI